MTITDRALQIAQAPLRVVQQVAGNGQHQEQLDESLRPVRDDLQGVRNDVADLKGELEALRKQIRNLRSKVNDIHEDTQHIRTEQASDAAGS